MTRQLIVTMAFALGWSCRKRVIDRVGRLRTHKAEFTTPQSDPHLG